MKRIVKGLVSALGYEVVDLRVSASEAAVIQRTLVRENTSLVLDVGANEGQYGHLLRSLGYHGEIFSFEPLLDPHARLVKRSARDRKWRVFDPVACGAAPGEAEINVAGNSVSSSLRPMLDAHRKYSPKSEYEGRQQVRVERLDRLVTPEELHGRSVLLKIDTQGFEEEVLKGADGILPFVAAIQLELSVAPLYQGQPDPWALLAKLQRDGFGVVELSPGFRSAEELRMLQFDAVLARFPPTNCVE
jgi:FkbM family methyltransferase